MTAWQRRSCSLVAPRRGHIYRMARRAGPGGRGRWARPAAAGGTVTVIAAPTPAPARPGRRRGLVWCRGASAGSIPVANSRGLGYRRSRQRHGAADTLPRWRRARRASPQAARGAVRCGPARPSGQGTNGHLAGAGAPPRGLPWAGAARPPRPSRGRRGPRVGRRAGRGVPCTGSSAWPRAERRSGGCESGTPLLLHRRDVHHARSGEPAVARAARPADGENWHNAPRF